MKQKDKIKVSLWVDMKSYERLCKLTAEKDSLTISSLIRKFINDGISLKANSEDIDRITDIIRTTN